jgi:hypothetical protein
VLLDGDEAVLIPLRETILFGLYERAWAGRQKYGTYLETGNGRDALWDAYQEALDLVMYLRQAILERESAARRRDDDPGPEEELSETELSFRRSWREALTGQTRPIETLWEDIEPE